MATAFAVFCATDGSLTFYNRDALPGPDSEFEGKLVSKVYIGFETAKYSSNTDVPWTNEVNDILSVSFAPEFASVKPISTRYWFRSMKNMTSFDGTNLDTSNVTDMASMFEYCHKLTSLDLSNFNTSNVTHLSYMFGDCGALTSLNISSFDTSNVITMSSMFNGCSSLTSLDVSKFNTSNVTNMNSMFSNCSSLTSLDLSSFDTSKVQYMHYMFSNCSSLKTIYVSELWSTSAVTSVSNSFNMFTGCTKLVGAIPYDSSKTSMDYANYTTGYLKLFFTFKYHDDRFVITGSDLHRIAEVIRKKIGTIDGLTFPEGFITALESIGIVSGDDGNGNVIVDMTGATVSYDNGNVVIS